jgi:hypothetical protein
VRYGTFVSVVVVKLFILGIWAIPRTLRKLGCFSAQILRNGSLANWESAHVTSRDLAEFKAGDSAGGRADDSSQLADGSRRTQKC